MPSSGSTSGTVVTESLPMTGVASPAACGCGQPLDGCRGAHCPRCGRDLPD
jgi:hypothetical protein